MSTDSCHGETIQYRNQGGTDTHTIPEVIAATVKDKTTDVPDSSMKEDEASDNEDHQNSKNSLKVSSGDMEDVESMMVSVNSLEDGKQVTAEAGPLNGYHEMDGVSNSNSQDPKLAIASQLYNERRLMFLEKCLIEAGFGPNEIDSKLIRDFDGMIGKE